MSVENNQDTSLDELKLEAKELGIQFRDNIGTESLKKKIEDEEERIAAEQRKKKEVKVAAKSNKVRVIIESREGDDAPQDQFFAYNSMQTGKKENILIKFGEEVEISEDMFEHIKNITYKEKKHRMKVDAEGIPQKEWYDVQKTRFIISKV